MKAARRRKTQHRDLAKGAGREPVDAAERQPGPLAASAVLSRRHNAPSCSKTRPPGRAAEASISVGPSKAGVHGPSGLGP